jgi:amino acid adenylation domain-containing protein
MSEAGLSGYPLAPQQLRLWRLDAGGRRGPLCAQASLTVAVPPGRLAEAIAVEAEIEMLGVRIRALPGMAEPLQVLDVGPPLQIDRRGAETGTRTGAIMAAHRDEPYDPSADAPLRVSVLDAEGEAIAVLTVSSLYADAASLAALAVRARERALGRAALPAEAPSFIDVAAWLREEEGRAAPAAGDTQPILPRAHPRPPEGPFRPVRLPLRVAGEATATGVPFAGLALAAWAAMPLRWGEGGRLMGISVSGTADPDLAGCFGPLSGMAAIRPGPGRSQRFDAFARQLATICAEAGMARAPGPMQFAFQDLTGIDGVADLRSVDAGFVLRLVAAGSADAPDLSIDYDASQLAEADALAVRDQFATLLHAALAAPGSRLDGLPIIAAPATHRHVRPAPGRTWIARLHDVVRRTPEAVALLDLQGRPTDYATLWGRASALRPALDGAGPETVVAIAARDPAAQVVAMVAAASTGAAFCVIDLDEPEARWRAKLDQLAAVAVLADAEAAGRLEAGPLVVSLTAAAAPPADLPPVDPASLAYLCFTSGSTGAPKRVAIEHRQLAAYLDGIAAALPLQDCRVMASVTTPAADLGHTALFAALCSGAALVPVPPRDARDPTTVRRIFAATRPDLLKITPGQLAALVSVEGAAVLPRRCLVLGGESTRVAQLSALSRAAPELAVFNHYGPSETTVGVLVRALGPADAEGGPGPAVALSGSLAGTAVHIVDPGGNPVPDGVRAELAVSGETVARGYPGRPAETAVRFRPDPSGAGPGARRYLSGDLARRMADGSLHLAGRTDRQLSLRGLRIEPGEIEAAVRSAPGVAEALVFMRGEGDAAMLVAYARRDPDAPRPATVESLRTCLSALLPAAICPQAVVLLDAFPLTANGKPDPARLPEVRIDRGGGPSTPGETRLAALWSELLERPTFGMEDNFFDLGGHSLLLIELQGRLRERMGVDLPIVELFRHTTVRALAARLEDEAPVDGGAVARASARAQRRRTAAEVPSK